jgi:hypothetical protein
VITEELHIPTVGIGAGPDCDAQVLVWQDALGLRQGYLPRFVKQYANLAQVIGDAAAAYVADVESGGFPTEQHTFAAELAVSDRAAGAKGSDRAAGAAESESAAGAKGSDRAADAAGPDNSAGAARPSDAGRDGAAGSSGPGARR